MKKITVFMLLVSILFVLALPANADNSAIVDFADLLNEEQENALSNKAQVMISRYGMDVVILTVDSTNGQYIGDFAVDYYDNNGYGLGENYSGVLFMLAMDTREWYISTCGDGIYAVTDYGVQMLFSEIAHYLSQNDYYAAFDAYLDELDGYYAAFTKGEPLDGYAPEYEGPGSYEPNYGDEIIYYEKPSRGAGSILLVSLVIGLIVGGISLLIMRSGMKTAKRQRGADRYLSSNVNITKHYHHYLYSHTSRRAKSDSSGSGRSGGGGSHVHRSSGGRSHGGGGGRF